MAEKVKNALTLFFIAAVFLIISRVVFRFVFPFFFLFFLLGIICIVLGISILKKGSNKRD
jgi:1,4-dihydroxy-2-naphthoate octaprenyltransferase